jgi:hypothetical protein
MGLNEKIRKYIFICCLLGSVCLMMCFITFSEIAEHAIEAARLSSQPQFLANAEEQKMRSRSGLAEGCQRNRQIGK